MRPAAFLFDLDGTLVDTEMLWAGAIANRITDCGETVSAEEVAGVVFGRNWFDIHATLLSKYACLPKLAPREEATILRSYYARLVGDPTAIAIPQAIAFFRQAARLAPCGIVSGSPHQDVLAAARNCGIADLLACIVGAEDCTRGKPAPDGYLKAATLLNVDASECVVIEDSTVGVQAGRAAGMRVLGIDRNPVIQQLFLGAEWIVHDLSEFDLDAIFDD